MMEKPKISSVLYKGLAHVREEFQKLYQVIQTEGKHICSENIVHDLLIKI